MKNPQTENGYTMIANEILEQLIKLDLSGQEFRIAFLIMRKTYGFHKKEDIISLSQMSKETNLSSSRCSQIINKLEDTNIITLSQNIQGISKKYRFNKDYSQWHTLSKKRYPISKVIKGVSQKRFSPYLKSDSTKDTLTKDKPIGVSPVKEVLKNFGEVFKVKFNAEYTCNFKKDTELVKTLLKQHNLEELKMLIDRFFKSEDKFITESGYTIGVFYSQVNKLKVELAEKNRLPKVRVMH